MTDNIESDDKRIKDAIDNGAAYTIGGVSVCFGMCMSVFVTEPIFIGLTAGATLVLIGIINVIRGVYIITHLD